MDKENGKVQKKEVAEKEEEAVLTNETEASIAKETDLYKERYKDYDASLDIDGHGFLSKVFLSWLSPLVAQGYRRRLEPNDIWYLQKGQEADTLNEKFWHIFNRMKREGVTKENIIWSVGLRAFWPELLLSLVLHGIYSALRFIGPFLLKRLTQYIEGSEEITSADAYLYAVLLGASQALSTLFLIYSEMIAYSVGLKYRSMLTSGIFDHVLKIDNKARQQTNQGQIVTLVSTDAQAGVELMKRLNRTLMAPFVLIAGFISIYSIIGVATFGGIAVLLGFVPISFWFGKLQIKIHREKLKLTDARLDYAKEILQGIKIVKLYAWEKPVMEKLADIRRLEMGALLRSMYLRAITIPVALVVPSIAAVMAFTVFLKIEGSIEPANAFAVVSLFVIIRSPFISLPLAITLISQAIVSYKRIGQFLFLSTLDRDLGEEENTASKPSELGDVIFEIKQGSFQWSSVEAEEDPKAAKDEASKNRKKDRKAKKRKENQEKQGEPSKTNGSSAQHKETVEVSKENGKDVEAFSLEGINLQIKKGELVAIIGRVGSGKSSLCSAILGEMPAKMSTGSQSMITKEKKLLEHVAYCNQEPFIINATVRENVLFKTGYQKATYQTAIEKSMLMNDLAIFPAGDRTEIGERGVTLSGGQKARVAIARAVYSDLDFYIFDDPLSAVDAHVANALFNNILGNGEESVLRNKTRILVTNQVQFLSEVDRIVVLEKGKIIQQGSYSELMTDNEGALQELLRDLISAENKHGDDNEVATKQEEDSLPKGSEEEEVKAQSEEQVFQQDKSIEKGKLVSVEKRAQGNIGWRYVKGYWMAGTNNSILLTVLLFSIFLVCEAVYLFIDSWLAIWSEDANSPISVNKFIGVYWGITFSYMFVILVRSLGFAKFGVTAAASLYEKMNQTVLLLPMSFFWKTPMGTILNRLSQDTFAIDEQLPQSWQWLLMTVVRVVGTLAFITTVSPIFAVVILPIAVLYFLIRAYYRATSRELQRIESISRSPLYNQLGESLTGVSTLRAYNILPVWNKLARKKIEHTHRAKFAVDISQLWLQERLEFLGGFIILCCGVSVVLTKDLNGIGAGLAGLALSQSLNITINLSFSVSLATMLEAQLNAVERVAEYSDLPMEDLDASTISSDANGSTVASVKKLEMELENGTTSAKDIEKGVVNDSWPSVGRLEFKNVWLQYRKGLAPALQDANLLIYPGETVGLVGRTGAGKSTIMMAMFRIVDLMKGQVLIDNIDIATISKRTLRTRLTLIPQDPVLFVGTLRHNLDPFKRYTDEDLYSAIDRAHLRETVDNLPKKLNAEIAENGSNLSVGQRSLVCLARALLRKSKIVLLDEATASVDSTTDKLIQATIRAEFKSNVTLVVIAHRLQTIIDSDKIAVLNAGRIAEIGHPHELLNVDTFRRTDGIGSIIFQGSAATFKSEFAALVKETGEESDTKLREIAKSAYESR